MFTLASAAYNLVRIRNLTTEASACERDIGNKVTRPATGNKMRARPQATLEFAGHNGTDNTL
jgi:hypothetical protein